MVNVERIALGVLRTAATLLSLAVGVVALFLLFYEVHDFRPSFSRLQVIYTKMDPEDRQPPENVQRFVWMVDGKMLDSFAAQQLLGELRGPMPVSAWHYHSFMLYWMMRWHLSKEQRLAIYCHYLPYETGQGFTNAAKFYFGKRPSILNVDELATIVAVGRAPDWNSPSRHPERLEATKKKLLSMYALAQ